MNRRSLILLAALVLVFLGALYLRQSRTAPAEESRLALCLSKYEMNSKEYWDCRFSTQDWQHRHGDKQSEYFYTLLIELLPEPAKAEIRANKYSVVDFGCAQGEGTELFAAAFPDSRVTGVDISTEAIKIARQKSRRVDFVAADLTAHTGAWDVLITSNTLEHFHEPWNVARRLLPRAERYFIILVPFAEKIVSPGEHFYSFNWDNIPKEMGEFRLTHATLAETNPRWWRGMQVLLLYARDKETSRGSGRGDKAERRPGGK